jgi:hypothetical protein
MLNELSVNRLQLSISYDKWTINLTLNENFEANKLSQKLVDRILLQ